MIFFEKSGPDQLKLKHAMETVKTNDWSTVRALRPFLEFQKTVIKNNIYIRNFSYEIIVFSKRPYRLGTVLDEPGCQDEASLRLPDPASLQVRVLEHGPPHVDHTLGPLRVLQNHLEGAAKINKLRFL